MLGAPETDAQSGNKKYFLDDFDNFEEYAIEYVPGRYLTSLNPSIGHIFKVFIPECYISFNNKHISKQDLYGLTYYAPKSDLAAISVHTGCLFINPKMKNVPVRRFCSAVNLFEALSVPEQDYSKAVKVFEYPIDMPLQGVVIDFYIDDSPGHFPSVFRNGLRSLELKDPDQYSIRVVDFNVITMYDEKPKIVSWESYQKRTAVVPKYIFSYTGEIGIIYEPQIFAQIFSRNNVNKGLLKVHKLYFEIGSKRYEILQVDKLAFRIILYSDGDDEVSETIIHYAHMTEFIAKKNSICVQNTEFTPVSCILLLSNSKIKFSRSTSFINAD